MGSPIVVLSLAGRSSTATCTRRTPRRITACGRTSACYSSAPSSSSAASSCWRLSCCTVVGWAWGEWGKPTGPQRRLPYQIRRAFRYRRRSARMKKIDSLTGRYNIYWNKQYVLQRFQGGQAEFCELSCSLAPRLPSPLGEAFLRSRPDLSRSPVRAPQLQRKNWGL